MASRVDLATKPPMVSPVRVSQRSPLKETDANTKVRSSNLGGITGVSLGYKEGPIKKRALECVTEGNVSGLETQPAGSILNRVKRLKTPERSRSIEGAVQVAKNEVLMNIAQKVTPNELIEWRNNWKKIMRRDSRIYFDITDDIDNAHWKVKLDKKRELLKRGFVSLGAQITQFFDASVTIVITRRSTDSLHNLSDLDILARAKKNYMKVWNYDKATRFLNNLDVDLDAIEREKNNASFNGTLSYLLQNEKIYGPTDRDPRTRRDDIHYFKYQHVYMYDLWQNWAPIITLEFKPQELANKENLPYPTLKMGSFGRCPFIGDRNCDEKSYKRVVKRFARDKQNEKYALHLRLLYQDSANPANIDINELDSLIKDIIMTPHECLDSQKSYEEWKEKYEMQSKIKLLEENKLEANGNTAVIEDTCAVPGSIRENTEGIHDCQQVSVKNSRDTKATTEDTKTVAWREPSITTILTKQIRPNLLRNETDDFPDDLCSKKIGNKGSYEIKASGVHQSNDAATSFGNGLGPTKASVMSKNIRTLNRLVVDRKLGISNLRENSAPVPNETIANSNAAMTTELGVQKIEDSSNTSLSMKINTTNDNNNLLQIEQQHASNDLSQIKARHANTTKQAPCRNQTNDAKATQAKVSPPATKTPGYCENCRVKYSSLDAHIATERHMSFASNDINFEAIDCLIDKLKFHF